MRKVFARTGNVDAFLEGMEVIQTAEPGHRMGLLYGGFGTGKTESVYKVCVDHNYIYVRAKRYHTTKSLLKNIARESGIPDDGGTDALYGRVLDEFRTSKQILFIDEVEYLCRQDHVLTLMDLHDESQCPIVMVGMQGAKAKLQKFPHLLDRCSFVIEYKELSKADVRNTAKQLCEVKLDDSAIDYIFEKGHGRFRRTKVHFARAERAAKNNNLKTVTGEHMKLIEGKRR